LATIIFAKRRQFGGFFGRGASPRDLEKPRSAEKQIRARARGETLEFRGTRLRGGRGQARRRRSTVVCRLLDTEEGRAGSECGCVYLKMTHCDGERFVIQFCPAVLLGCIELSRLNLGGGYGYIHSKKMEDDIRVLDEKTSGGHPPKRKGLDRDALGDVRWRCGRWGGRGRGQRRKKTWTKN